VGAGSDNGYQWSDLLLADWLSGRTCNDTVDSQRETIAGAAPDSDVGLSRRVPARLRRGHPALWTPPVLTDSFTDIIADRLLPAQEYVPTRDAAFFAEVAHRFNYDAASASAMSVSC
jgi:hypothetical protein